MLKIGDVAPNKLKVIQDAIIKNGVFIEIKIYSKHNALSELIKRMNTKENKNEN